MALRIRSSALETRSARLKLPLRKKPYWQRLTEGLALGYRRGPGTWSVRVADGRGGNWVKLIAPADDYEGTQGALSYFDAQLKAREHVHGAEDNGKPVTVAQAIELYARDLKTRQGESGNVSRVKFHLTPSLGSKIVAHLSMRDCRAWRDHLLHKGCAPATVVRTCKGLAAALAFAAAHDPQRIKNREAWRLGLAALPDSSKTRHVILTDDQVRAIVYTGYELGERSGMLLEVLASTGVRPVQAFRLVVGDVLTGREPRLMMPSAKKGKGLRRIEHTQIPISAALATKLKAASRGRDLEAPLLLRADGKPWHKTYSPMVREVVRRVGLDPDTVTAYALRHTHISGQLLKNVPARLVAALHNTSVREIERTYSKNIGDHAHAIVRAAMVDLTVPPGRRAKVVPLR
jgi:integrase